MSGNKTMILLAMAVAIVIISPWVGLDLLIIAGVLAIYGHRILQEKLLLAFIIVRPVLDAWRDVSIVSFGGVDLNVNAALAVLFSLWACRMLYRHRDSLPRVPAFRPLAVFIALSLFSVVYSVAPATTIIEWLKLFVIAPFFALSYIFIKEKIITPGALLVSLFASAVIPIAIGIFQLATSTGLRDPDLGYVRIFGPFAHPSVFAFFLLFIFLAHVEFTSLRGEIWQKHKLGSIILGLLFLTLLFLTYTRAAIIGLVFFLVIIGSLRYRKVFAATAGSIAVFYMLFFPLNDYLKETYHYSLQKMAIVERLTTRNDEADSIDWRLGLARDSLPLIVARPVFGYGFGTFPSVWTLKRPLKYLYQDNSEAHNDYLRIQLETGILGLSAYAAFLGFLLLKAWQMFLSKLRDEHLWLFTMIATFATLSLSDNMLHHTAVAWFVFSWLGMKFALAEMPHKSPSFV